MTERASGESEIPTRKILDTGTDPEVPEVPPSPSEDKNPSVVQSDKSERLSDPESVHQRLIDRHRLNFALILTYGCICIYALGSVVWAILDHDRGAASLPGLFELLKFVATSALGFIFGKGFDRRQ